MTHIKTLFINFNNSTSNCAEHMSCSPSTPISFQQDIVSSVTFHRAINCIVKFLLITRIPSHDWSIISVSILMWESISQLKDLVLALLYWSIGPHIARSKAHMTHGNRSHPHSAVLLSTTFGAEHNKLRCCLLTSGTSQRAQKAQNTSREHLLSAARCIVRVGGLCKHHSVI